jgi:uncharacterized protein
MAFKRIHFIKNNDAWILFYCDTIQYKCITDAEKRKYQLIAKNVSREDFFATFPQTTEAEYAKIKEDLIDDGSTACVAPPEKIRLTLNVANSCNMKCGYCYANGGVYHSKEQLMSFETAKKAVDLFYAKYHTLGSIKFIGGEPLMNKEVVEAVCDYVWELFNSGKITEMPDFIIATNGTILDDKIIEYSNKYNWRVGLSFDGPEKIHDIVRTYRNGTSTVASIKENIKRWRAGTNNRCPSSVNACYSGVHEKNGVTVVNAVSYIKEELGIEKVNIVPVDASKDSSFALSSSSCFVDAIQEIFNKESPEYRKNMFTKLKNMEKAIKNHISMPPTICKAGLQTFGVSVHGVISPCHMLTDETGYYMGNVDNTNALEEECFLNIQNQLEAFDRYTHEQCGSCFANRLCVGCLGGNVFRCGDPYKSDPAICTMVKGAITEILKDICKEEV